MYARFKTVFDPLSDNNRHRDLWGFFSQVCSSPIPKCCQGHVLSQRKLKRAVSSSSSTAYDTMAFLYHCCRHYVYLTTSHIILLLVFDFRSDDRFSECPRFVSHHLPETSRQSGSGSMTSLCCHQNLVLVTQHKFECLTGVSEFEMIGMN